MGNYYRPEWTCGRYNAEHQVAIFYNLIEGMSYLFEDFSAVVIGSILKSSRNGKVDIVSIAQSINKSEEETQNFFEELCNVGLLTKYIPNEDIVDEYRKNLRAYRQKEAERAFIALQGSSTLINDEDVEIEFTKRCGGIFSVMLELTYNCSEKCIHCYNPGATRNEEEKNHRNEIKHLTFAQYKHLIDELKDMGVVKVCLTGGDPFSNPLAWDIIEYLWEKEMIFDIFTNGQMVVECAKRLASCYPRTIGISLYSDIPEVHDKITRVEGSHAKTKKFIAQCSALAVPSVIKCCIMRPNVKSYFTVKDVAKKYGMLAQFDLNITDSLDGDICASQMLRLREKEMEIVLRDSDLPYYIDGASNDIPTPKQTSPQKMCNAGINSLCITPNGDVQPCCAFPMKCGNITFESLSSILGSRLLVKWAEERKTSETECLTHDYCRFCQLCAGNNYNSTGSYLIPSENNCFLAKARFQLNEKLKAGDDPLQSQTVEEQLQSLEIKLDSLHRIKRVNGIPS